MMVSAEHDPRRAGTIWTLSLDEPIPEITPLVAANFRQVGAESVPELIEAMGADKSQEILKRFETGRRCFAAWVQGKIAAYGWVSFDEEFIGELGLRLRLLPGEAYIWDCATLPTFRQAGLYSTLLSFISGVLHVEHINRIWIGADLENVASQRGIARAGFRYVADLVVARVLVLRLVWVLGRPGVPGDLVTEARRAFLDNRDKAWPAALSLVKRG